jgi:hypothetical protein
MIFLKKSIKNIYLDSKIKFLEKEIEIFKLEKEINEERIKLNSLEASSHGRNEDKIYSLKEHLNGLLVNKELLKSNYKIYEDCHNKLIDIVELFKEQN